MGPVMPWPCRARKWTGGKNAYNIQEKPGHFQRFLNLQLAVLSE